MQTVPSQASAGNDSEVRHANWRVTMNSKYEIVIFWSTEDNAFVAEVPELPGCMAHGGTEELALKNVKDAIQLWVDTAREFGDFVPEPKGRRLMYA